MNGRRSLILALGLALAVARVGSAQLTFTDVSSQAGVKYVHGYVNGTEETMPKMISGGVASGDFDGDDLVDLFSVRGDIGRTRLFRNLGDGTFQETAVSAGVNLTSGLPNGPFFADITADGLVDLLVGSILQGTQGAAPRVFENQGDGTFLDTTSASGVAMVNVNTYSWAVADYDRDGDLDLLSAHWQVEPCDLSAPCGGHLWKNNGDGTFSDADIESGLSAWYTGQDKSFVPNFADVNNDRWPDILFVGDFDTSRVWLNDGDGTFTDVTDDVTQSDENGMGAGIGDVNNDGNLDWFVTSIFNESADPPKTGNRLYLGQGDGTFVENSLAAGVQDGDWGWGACAADLDNDGWLDLVHVNGWEGAFPTDTTRVFMSNGDGTFTDRAADFGLVDMRMGRGLVCFDYDRDGDIDIFIASNSADSALWRNDGGNANQFLNVTLRALGANQLGIGGRVTAGAGGSTQMREIKLGANFESNDPAEAHFGLGTATLVDELKVTFPDGAESTHAALAAGQFLRVEELFGDAFDDGAAPEADYRTGTWHQSSGGLHGAPGGGPQPTALITFPFDGCDVCQVQARLSAVSTGGNPEVKMLGWLDGQPNNVSATLRYTQDQLVYRQFENGVQVGRSVVGTSLVEGTVYDLKIDFDGTTYRVYLDGQLLVEQANAAAGIPFGGIGFVTRNAELTLDNLSVARVVERLAQ